MPINISPTHLPNTIINDPYEKYVTALGSAPPCVFQVHSGTLPTGIQLLPAGPDGAVFLGPATQWGEYNFEIEVTDSDNASAIQAYSITVYGLVIQPPNNTTLPLATLNELYPSCTSTTSGASGQCVWDVVSGSLPAGLAYRQEGNDFILSGTPAQAGTFIWTVAVSDDAGNQGIATYTLSVGLQILPQGPALPSAINGATYSETLSAVGNSGECTWVVESGSLPPGIGLVSISPNTCELTGTVSSAGNWSFTVSVTDQTGIQGKRSYTIQTKLSFSPAVVPDSVVGTPYAQIVSAEGGTHPYHYSWIGNLPPGITYSDNTYSATFSGVATTAGTYAGALAATDELGNSGYQAYTFTSLIRIIDGSLPASNTGNPYYYVLQAEGGATPYTWQLESGSLPAGLTLSNGTISGTPTACGQRAFTLRVTDDRGNTNTGDFSIDVGLGFLPGSLANRSVGVEFADPITVQSASTGPFTFSISSGALPSGLSLVQDGSGTCSISGTPSRIESSTFTLSVIDTETDESGSQGYTLSIIPADLVVLPQTLPEGSLNKNYSVQFSTSGGTSPYQYTLSSGTLQSGITLSNSGLLSGIPVENSVNSIAVQVIDNLGSITTKNYTLAIAATDLHFTSPSTLPATKQGVSYLSQITASGGFTPYVFTAAGGRFPPGLTLSTSGNITGIPTSQGQFLFSVTCTDRYGLSATQSVSLSVERNEIEILPVTVPIAREGMDYSVQFEASGSEPPYLFELYAGSLPYGLSLSESGELTGIPVLEGVYQFIIGVSANGIFSSRTYQLVVYPVAPDSALRVTVGGIPQKLDVDYIILTRDPVSIRFMVPPPEGVIVEIKVYRGHTWADPGAPTDGSETLTYYGPLEPERTYSVLNSEINT